MSGTTSNSTFGASPWNHEPGNGWGGFPPWLRQFDIKPVWIALTVVGFIAWWPIGLALLIFLVGSGRMGCGFGRRHGGGYGRHWRGWACGNDAPPATQQTSGNRAFDEYRTETLHRLEEEQREFATFLDRLRFARDKSEFDAFMAERRRPPEQPDPAQPGPAAGA